MSRELPLHGVTVIDLGQIYNGPYATFLMAMAGARVIKVEPPGGENLRRRSVVGGAALPFAMLNSNKRFVSLNLKEQRGREILRTMVRRSDALLENFAPGVMDRLGVGYDALREINPRLIYASGSGYGLSGPYRDLPAMDLTVQAASGIMSVTGFPDRSPVRAGPAVCDFSGGVHLYGAVMTALFERERTGLGRRVEVAMLEAVYASLSSSLGLWYGSGGEAPARTGNRHGGLAESPYNVYPAADGHIAILCVGETHWKSLLTALDREDLLQDERFSTLAGRVAHMETVDALVGEFTAGLSKAELMRRLQAQRVPCAAVRDLEEVTSDPHLHERGFLEEVDHPQYGRVTLPRSPMRYEDSALPAIEPSAELGAHNEDIYGGWLGMPAADLQALRADGVI
ncbi:CaiB/BaiF CoA transferase family protein [Bordetella genomosp. 12]|uniref:CoA transferase n=1 Tax=Bordetella genomosp. 12 TaxID=463035 RepID=A0A261VVR4_9BORD|nr:CoA transferase [Bordetella genomosp. 12]OZI77700.1 CoA transferase [Bordetella genomosp. 12]